MDLATFVAEWLTGSILGIIALGAAGSALFAGVMQAFCLARASGPSITARRCAMIERQLRRLERYQSNPLLGIARLIFLATFAIYILIFCAILIIIQVLHDGFGPAALSGSSYLFWPTVENPRIPLMISLVVMTSMLIVVMFRFTGTMIAIQNPKRVREELKAKLAGLSMAEQKGTTSAV